ncbi:MAG: protein kinase domain-containing protein [Pyrinomonadaceae bacterium]
MFLAIFFNVDELGPAYGLGAYQLLFRTVDLEHVQGCYFSDGDIGEKYCIAIESSDARSLFKIEAAVGSSNALGFAGPNARLTFDAHLLNYLAPAGYISHQGKIERAENSWMQSAWDACQTAKIQHDLVVESDTLSPSTIIETETPQLSSTRPPEEYAPGDLIGNDYVVRGVRKGGMGVVYIVEDLKSRRQSIQLRLALKTFQSRYLWNDEAVARFEREALVWIDLGKHSNIVHAMLVERIANRPYLWLEFVEGESLAEWLARERLSSEQAINFGLQFCRGMRHAHEEHAIIHRDIKPANTLVTNNGVLKITDFGLSKLQAELAGEACAREGRTMSADDTETVTGKFVTAAGQCMGTPAYIAPEAITAPQTVDVRSDIYSFGVMLYEMLAGERPFRAGNILRDHLESVPAPLTLVNSNVSAELSSVVACCLEKGPNRRFQSFAELELVLLSVPENTSRIEFATADVTVVPEFGQAFMKGFALMQFGKYEEAIECFRQVIAAKPDEAEAWNNIGVCLARLERIDEALPATQKAVELKADYAEAWSTLAALYELQQRYEEGMRACQRAIELKPRWAEAHSNLGSNLAQMGRVAEAKSSFYRAIAEDHSYWLAYLKLAQLFAAERSLPQALNLLQAANEINPRQPDLLAALAACLTDMGEKEEAARYLELALQVDSRHPLALKVAAAHKD